MTHMNCSEPEEGCPYLDTVTRTLLDFDFEHSCSISLDRGPHIYCCLVCGKFFRGRGRSTPAYTHSVHDGHNVFVHLSRGTFHCLPDDYEIKDPSLCDISAALRPLFSEAEIRSLDNQTNLSRDLFGRRYLPGFIGLSSLNKTDYINSTVQALSHVKPLRDFFLRCSSGKPFQYFLKYMSPEMKKGKKRYRDGCEASRLITIDPQSFSPVAFYFGETIRKIWSDKRFKSTVNPHMFVQAVSVASKNRFSIGKQSEVGDFLTWLLHQLHIGIGGTKRAGSSVIHEIFQGVVEVTVQQRLSRSRDDDLATEFDDDDRLGSDDEHESLLSENKDCDVEAALEEVTSESNFMLLTLDIPQKPLFKNDNGGIVIPQEPLVSLLKKFDGVTSSDATTSGFSQKRRYHLRQLPDYLIFHLRRFTKNRFSNEKNPTIVPFQLKNLDLSSYYSPKNERSSFVSQNEIRMMSVDELKAFLQAYGAMNKTVDISDQSQLIASCLNILKSTFPNELSTKYDLVSNIAHSIPADVGREGHYDPLEEGHYKCHVQHTGTGQWYEVQDLHVQEIMPQLVGLSESSVLIFEKKRSLSTKSSCFGLLGHCVQRDAFS